MENKYNSFNTTPPVDIVDEEWYQNAKAIFNARMADYHSYGQPGSYSNYLLEARKYKSNMDPLETMGYLNAQQTIDSQWEYFETLGKNVYNGYVGVYRDTLNGIRAARDYNIALLNEQAKEQGIERNPDQRFVNALDSAAKIGPLQPYEVKQSASTIGQFGQDVAQGAGQLAGQMTVSIPAEAIAPGLGGLAMMVAQITGGQYEDLKAKGVDTKRAAEAAFANAVIQAPFERLSLTRLMRKIPAGTTFKKKAKMVFEDLLTEGSTEFIQQFPEEWAEQWALNPDKSWKELRELAAKKFPDTLQNALYAGLIGGVLGAGSRGIHIALDRNINMALQKELHDEKLDAIGKRVDSIKQSGVSPDYAAETINANLNNSTVLIDGGTLLSYAQKAGEEKTAEKLGVSMETIKEAKEKGDVVEVPQGNFEALSASNPDFYETVRDDVSFDTKDMSNRKYETLQRNIETYSKMGEEQRKELKNEVDKIVASAIETGRVDKSMSDALKVLYTRFALTARPDNPAQFWKDNPLRFERGNNLNSNAIQLMQPMRDENRVYVRNSANNIDWGTIANLTADDGTEIIGAPVRMQIGFQVGEDTGGAGYTHIVNRHPEIIKKYGGVEKAISAILQNPTYVVKETKGNRQQLLFVVENQNAPSDVVLLELSQDDGNYYTVISLSPKKERNLKDKKKKALSFNGSATPFSASGDGAYSTPTGIEAGTIGDLRARKDNAFSDISISEAENYVKNYTYPDAYNQTVSTESLQEAADRVNTVELNAVSAKDPESRKYMKEQMLKRGMEEEDADGLLALLDGIVNDVVKLAKKYPAMLEWQERGLDRVFDEVSGLLLPKLSAFKKNGEYPINIDLGSLCMKREAADVLNQIIIDQGMGQQLGPTQLEALKDLLKSYKYLTACDVCFVEAKRARMLADANKTSYDWKSTLIAAGITDDQELGQERVFTDEQLARLRQMTDPATYKEAFEKYMPQDRRRTKTGGNTGADLDTGTTPDKMVKIAKLFLEDPALAGVLDPTMLITTRGTDYLARTYGGHTNIMPTLAGMYGSATSKPLEGFTLYDPLSWRKNFDNKGYINDMDAIYDIGGGRAQSFTDFNPILFLDYVQMVADYEARNMPMHVYTKVPSFVQLFGLTGIMINMSFVPEIVDGVGEKYAGLRYNEKTGEYEYAWSEDSFPIEEAYKMRKRKEYGGRVGIIAVGVSDEHIRKLMRDPNIDMVIPYHKSGMPVSVQMKTGLDIATDYTKEQTTKYGPGAIEKYGENYFNYSRILIETGDPRKAAKEYLRRCDATGSTPVFSQFRNEDGYYKVLEDFRGYDNAGNGVIQGPVRLSLPKTWKKDLDAALADRTKQKKMIGALKTNKEILDKVRQILKPQRLDGEIREVMMKRLTSALGQKKMSTAEKEALRAKYPKTWRKQRTANVQSLKKSEFFDKLEQAYAASMSVEAAKGKVEVFRMGNGIVYGFAIGGQIFLNENSFNANTPAHEFTHIWAKVAQAKNTELWAEGVKLLKTDAKEMWDEVTNDPLYENIKDNEDAIASEVLARIVGQQNEEFVRGLLDPTQKLGKGKGLLKQIQDWLVRMFNEVRSLFDPLDGKPLTYEEFSRMPLKTLWDVDANKQFRKQSWKTLQELQEQSAMAQTDAELQAAYHGTGSRFDRFSTDFMGTGEGAQVHGWGLYFAQDRSVAEGYRSRLLTNNLKYRVMLGDDLYELDSRPWEHRWKVNGKQVILDDIQSSALKILANYGGGMDKTISFLKGLQKSAKSTEEKTYYRDLIKYLQTNKKNLSVPEEDRGQVFEVDIPDNDVLLDEDLPLNQQPKKVQEAIHKYLQSRPDNYIDSEDLGEQTGEKFYNDVVFQMQREGKSNPAEAASKLLNSFGIEGITYWGRQDGRSFVVFDDKAIKVLDKYYQRQQEASEIKGSFDPFTDVEAVIKLFDGADASTVIHETGHYFIESLWREIEAGRATEQQKADFEKLMQYCGLTTDQWAKLDTKGKTAAHERLAEAFETYIMEDKAPSRELRPVFQRFAKWLKDVYAAISRNKNAVPITNEVREVFDRMLASEEDVEQMRRVEGYFEKLPAVITDNLSPATKKRIEDYILKAQDKAVEILTKERLANFTDERKEKIEKFRERISDEVRQEVANRPLYVAARAIRETFGEKPAPAKSYARQYLDNKMSPERIVEWSIIAEQNGFAADELAVKLRDEPNETEAYNAAMDEAVQKEFPDYYTNREQAEEATRLSMYNDEAGILLGVEQVLIEDFAYKAKAQQRSAEAARKLAMAKRQQAKVAAQKELANMKVKDAVRVDRFINAERRCAVKSAEAMAKKDYETARHYKDMQAFNHACVIESANLRKRRDQYSKFLRRQIRAKKETWTSEQHFNQAQALFARMGLPVNRDYDPTTRLQTLTEYLAEMGEEFNPFDEVPNWLADDTWPIQNPNNMTFDDYEKVINLIRYIKAMARAEKAENIFDSAYNYQEWKEQAIEGLNKLSTKFSPILGERQTATLLDTFKAAYQTLDNFLEKMDGWNYGFFSRTFGDAIKHANDKEFKHLEAYRKRKAEVENAWCPTKEAVEEAGKEIYYEELGTTANKFVLTKMLMNLGNEGNARKLCSSYPSEALRGSSLWVFSDGVMTNDEAIEQTKENLLEFLGKVLTKEDIAYAQAKIDLAGMFWGEIADLERRTKGFTPPKVEAYPVTLQLANGETVVFRGGYFPLIRNGEMGSHPVGVMPVSDTDPKQGKNIRTMYTDTGHTKSRVEAVYPVDLTDGSEDFAMRQAIHDLCWRETMTDFRRILNDQFMFGLMKSKLGIADMKSFREMLEQAAQPNGGFSMAMGESLFAQMAGWLRRKTVNSIVMLNLRINLQNIGNFFLYGNAVEGFTHADTISAMANAFNNGFDGKSFMEMWRFVDEKSAFMRERSTNPDITLTELREEGKLGKYERAAIDWGAKAMMHTDGFTARPVWMQAYTKKLNSGSTEQEAIDYADTIIRRTLGSGRVTDVASMQRGGPVFRLFTAFQGFFNTQFNQWMREYNIDRRLFTEGEYKDLALRVTSFVASKYLIACLANVALALEPPFEDDDNDGYNNYAKELLHYPMSLIGIYGAMANELMDRTLGVKSYGYRMSIIQSSAEKIFRTGSKLGKVAEGDFESALEGLTDIAGIGLGVPAQLNRLFWNAYDIFVNDMEPEWGDLTTRRPKRKR